MHDQSYPPNPAQPEPDRRSNAVWYAVIGVLAVLLVAGGIAAFGPFRSTSSTTAASDLPASRGASSAGTSAVSSTIEIPTSVEVPTEEPTVPVSNPTGGPVANPNPGGGGSSSGGGAPTPPAPSGPAPAITSFTTPENIDCHNGDFQNFTASWSTTNAVKVTISIDGPGVYKTYGPTGSDSLPFNCSSPHTFLLTAYGQDGRTATKSITLQPRNVQMPSSGDEDPDQQGATPDDEI